MILHVPEGVYGVILGNIHTNYRTFGHLVEDHDCIISPLCEFEIHNYNDIPQGAWCTIQVPHIAKNPAIETTIIMNPAKLWSNTEIDTRKRLPMH